MDTNSQMQRFIHRAPLRLCQVPRYASTSTSAEANAIDPALKPKTKRKAPPLPRPFGVSHDAPLNPKTKDEIYHAKLEKNQATRKMLMGELRKSYFQDFAQVKQTGGKLWTAPDTVIQAKKSLYFPEIHGIALSDKSTKHTADLLKGKITLLSVLSSRLSVEHVNSFIKCLPPDITQDPDYQLVQINLQENFLKSFLISMFLSTLRKEVPASRHDKYLLVSQNLEMLHQPLGMANKHIGYVYLIDQESRIRWAACGFAEPEEAQGLTSCLSVLLNRLKTGAAE